MVNESFWSGKRVFLTGHTGFKGSWLSLWLQSLGAAVYGYALDPATTPNLYKEARVGELVHSVVGDVRDADGVREALLEAEPDVVIHMAAQALVRPSYADPVHTYATNVMGTVHVLEAARRSKSVKCFVSVTTDKCYENREWDWGYRESEPLGGHDPYSSSKACAEHVTAAYRSSFFRPSGIAVASARAGNVIGGGDWATDRLIPDLLRSFESGVIATIRNPKSIRPWQHVLEPLSGYLLLAERLWNGGDQFAGAWNFGPADDDAIDVAAIADRMVRLWGRPADWARDAGEHPHEASYLKLDCSKARNHLSWHPRWRLPEALERIVSWHTRWLAGEDPRHLCLRDITDFTEFRTL